MHTVNFTPKVRDPTYIMIFNLYPIKNLISLKQARTLFLHDLFKKKEIDICVHIFYLLAHYVKKKKQRMTLPLTRLIMRILIKNKVQFPTKWTSLKREDPITDATMLRSKLCLLGAEKQSKRKKS
nr:hypothetical protein CFP56_47410 [Quercus suber]